MYSQAPAVGVGMKDLHSLNKKMALKVSPEGRAFSLGCCTAGSAHVPNCSSHLGAKLAAHPHLTWQADVFDMKATHPQTEPQGYPKLRPSSV